MIPDACHGIWYSRRTPGAQSICRIWREWFSLLTSSSVCLSFQEDATTRAVIHNSRVTSLKKLLHSMYPPTNTANITSVFCRGVLVFFFFSFFLFWFDVAPSRGALWVRYVFKKPFNSERGGDSHGSEEGADGFFSRGKLDLDDCEKYHDVNRYRRRGRSFMANVDSTRGASRDHTRWHLHVLHCDVVRRRGTVGEFNAFFTISHGSPFPRTVYRVDVARRQRNEKRGRKIKTNRHVCAAHVMTSRPIPDGRVSRGRS